MRRALLAVLLLAGCLAAPAPFDAPTPTVPGDTPPERAEFSACLTASLQVVLDKDKVAAALPHGYGVDVAGTTLAAHLVLKDCGAIVLDNRTVVKPFQMEQLLVAVVAAENASSDSADLYALELVVSDPTVQEALGRAGFQARLGQVDLQLAAPTLEARVTLDGAQAYSYTGVGETEPDGNPRPEEGSRVHQANPCPAWMDVEQWKEGTKQVGVGAIGTLTVSGGALAQFIAGGVGAPTRSAIGFGHATATFPSFAKQWYTDCK